jgi:hypothetical protein
LKRPSQAWADRKKAYAEGLAHADASTLLVSIADKLHNARATLGDLKGAADSRTIWKRFSATPEQVMGNYLSLINAYHRGVADPRRDPLDRELALTVNQMQQISRQ